MAFTETAAFVRWRRLHRPSTWERSDPNLIGQPSGQEEGEQLPRTGRTDPHEGVDREKARNSQISSNCEGPAAYQRSGFEARHS